MVAYVEKGIYLSFSDRPRTRSKCQPILWPLVVHRVLYPETKTNPLNIFQKAVLGLVRAGIKRANDIAELTGLHSELVQLIIAQCISHVWLNDTADELTESGLSVLNDEDNESVNLKSGYLFQDAVTGDFWPRFVPELTQIEERNEDEQYPTFAVNRKTGRYISPYFFRAEKNDLPLLNSESLRKTYRDYIEDFRASQQIGVRFEPLSKVKLQGIHYIDSKPQSANILLWVTSEPGEEKLWSVKDPFEIRESAWWLEERLPSLLLKYKGLRDTLSRMIDIPDSKSLSNEEWLTELDKRAELDILIEYPWINSEPDFRTKFARLLKWKVKINEGTCEYEDLESAVGECQKLLEVVMQWLISEYPVNQAQLSGVKNYRNRKILSVLPIPSFDDEVKRVLAYQDLGPVISASRNPKKSFKALLFAAGLASISHPRHPLKLISHDSLHLSKALELADVRNQGAHGQSKYIKKAKKDIKLTEKIVLEYINYSMNFTECFKEWIS